MNNIQDFPQIDIPGVSKEDVDQEIALLQLEGHTTIKRSFVIARLKQRDLIFDEAPATAIPLWSEEPVSDPAVTQQLIDWAFEQNEKISEKVFAFLDDPSNDDLPSLLNFLKNEGIQIKKSKPSSSKSLTVFIKDLLRKKSYDMDDLYSVARANYPSRRPEAAIRQIIRRLYQDGMVIITEGKVRNVSI